MESATGSKPPFAPAASEVSPGQALAAMPVVLSGHALGIGRRTDEGRRPGTAKMPGVGRMGCGVECSVVWRGLRCELLSASVQLARIVGKT